MTKKLSSRQIAIILFLSVVSQKFIVLPVVIFHFARQDTYLVVIFLFLVDFITLFIYIWFIKKYPNVRMVDAFEEAFGKFITKLIYLVLLIYLFVKVCIVLKEAGNYLTEVLFDDINWAGFVFPAIFLLGYIMIKSTNSLGRSVEFFFLIILIGIIFSMVISLKNIDHTYLLPFMYRGVGPIAEAALRGSYAFGDYLFLMLFAGTINVSKDFKKIIIKYALLATALVIGFYILYITAFGNNTISQGLAISDLSLNSSNPVAISRIDWFTIIIWTITLILQTGMVGHCLNSVFSYIFKMKKGFFSMLILVSLILLILIITLLSLKPALYFVVSIPYSIFAVSVHLGMPILVVLSHLIKRKKKDVKFIQENHQK